MNTWDQSEHLELYGISFGFTEGKNINEPGFWLNLYLFMFPQLIIRKKLTPGIEALAIARVVQSNRSYRGITYQNRINC
jgi:hypothetical protein